MGQTLTNGIYLPNEGERNCYSGLAANWNAVDTLKGNYSLHAINVDIHVTAAEKETWNGKADNSALTAHTGNTTIHVTAEDKQAWNGKADASALTAHTGDTTIHVTAEDKEAWNGKADNSALTAHTGDTTIHVTAEDKAKWDAVTSKADDSDVVHKSGDEIIAGVKTFSDNITLQGTTTPVIKTISNIVQDTSAYNGSVSWVIRDKDNLNNILESSLYKYSGKGIDWQLKLTGIDNGVSNNKGIRFTLDPVNNVANFLPIGNNNTSFGNSSTKWKDACTYLINGLTPSSLGMPSDRSARIDISSYITNLGNGNDNRYTVPANGYIFLYFTSISGVLCFSQTSGGLTNYAQTFTRYQGEGQLYAFFPVRKGDTFIVKIYTSSTAVVQNAYFIPCQGNV